MDISAKNPKGEPLRRQEAEQDCQVSFVVLCFNERHHLDACLSSILNQDYARERYEVVLIDNGSTDGTGEYVQAKYPEVRVVRWDHNLGCSRAVNQTLPYMRMRYMAFVNPDCVLHKSWLREMMSALQNEPRALMAHSNTIHPWYPEWSARGEDRWPQRSYVCDMTLLGVHEFCITPLTPDARPIPTLGDYNAAGVIDLRVIEKTGYLADPDFYCYTEDLDLALRVNLAGYKVLFVPKAVAYHNTRWTMNLKPWSLRKSLLSTRNTILAFYKISDGPEFLVMLPLLLLGNLYKARQHALSPARQWLYVLACIPQTLLALVEALTMLLAYRERRAETLRHRVVERWWLFNRIHGRNWKPDPRIWIPMQVKTGTLDVERLA